MKWFSTAARVLAILLAIVLVCAPVCPPHHCSSACCTPASDHCGSGLDQNLACLRASLPEAPSASVQITPLTALSIHALVPTAEDLPADHSHIPISRHPLHPSAPPLTLRI